MIKYQSAIKNIYIIILCIFFHACKEENTILITPNNNLQYDFKVFKLNEDNSASFREGEGDYDFLPLTNSGTSSKLYLGNIKNDETGYGGKSYIYIKIKKELLSDDLFCDDDDFKKLNKAQLKLYSARDTDDLYHAQHISQPIFDCGTIDNRNECDDYAHCFWYQQIDNDDNIVLESCNSYNLIDGSTSTLDNIYGQAGGSPGDFESFGSNFVKAYKLNSPITYIEDDAMNHDQMVTDLMGDNQNPIDLNTIAVEIPISIDSGSDYITVDLMGHIYSNFNQQQSGSTCSGLDYTNCTNDSGCHWEGETNDTDSDGNNNQIDNICLVNNTNIGGQMTFQECDLLSPDCQWNGSAPASAATCTLIDNNGYIDGINCSSGNCRAICCNDNNSNGQCDMDYNSINCVDILPGPPDGICDNPILNDGDEGSCYDEDLNFICDNLENPIGLCGDGICDYFCGAGQTGQCIVDISTNLSAGISERQDWCDNNTDDIDIVLEYNPATSVLSNQLIEIYSSDDSYLYYNPYLYLNYDKEKDDILSVNKYIISTIASPYLDCQKIHEDCEWLDGDCVLSVDAADPSTDCTIQDASSSGLYQCGGGVGTSDDCDGLNKTQCDANPSGCQWEQGYYVNGGQCKKLYNGSCDLFNDGIDQWGMILAYDQFSLYGDGTLNNSNPNNYMTNITETDCSLLTVEVDCNASTNCEFVDSACQHKLVPSLISSDFEGPLFEFEVEVKDQHTYDNYYGNSETVTLDFSDIVFKLSNVGFIYANTDPSEDNYNIDDNETGTEGNSTWDFTDNNDNSSFDYSIDSYDKFDDFGLDICQDELEAGSQSCLCEFDDIRSDVPSCEDFLAAQNQWNTSTKEGTGDINQDGKITAYDIMKSELSPYNSEGTEGNEQLNWIDKDSNAIWTDNVDAGEQWYDWGYDHVSDNFESGCFSDINPYGGNIISWEQIVNQSWQNHVDEVVPGYGNGNPEYTYQTLVDKWKQDTGNTNVDQLLDYNFSIFSPNDVKICGGLHWANKCSTCTLNDPNGDNKNADPLNDDWNDCGRDSDCSTIDADGSQNNSKWESGEGFEENDIWDGVENGDGVCEAGECEEFFDFGLDGLPDIYENYNYDVEDDNYLATEACELPINTIYLSDNEIWYNIDFQIDSFNMSIPCGQIGGATGQIDVALSSSGSTFTSNGSFVSLPAGCGILTTLTYCDYNNELDCENDNFCIWSNNSCESNSIFPSGMNDIQFNAGSNLVSYYYKTENNGHWDWKDLNDNCEFDISLDLHEQFFDLGIDQLLSSEEVGINGEIFNNEGIENNFTHNFSGSDYIEKFDDFGIDGIGGQNINCSDCNTAGCNRSLCDSIGCSWVNSRNECVDDDDYNIDPNEDNYNVVTNSEGKEKNNNFDDWNNIFDTWGEDLDGDLLWTACQPFGDPGHCTDINLDNDYLDDGENEGERWYDWGYDHMENSKEELPYSGGYLNSYANLALGQNSYALTLDGADEITFTKPTTNSSDQLVLWISKISKRNNNYIVEVSVSTIVDVIAFQLQLIHDKLVIDNQIEFKEDLVMFPYLYDDIDGNFFPSTSELINDGQKYILDASIYALDNNTSNDLRINYAHGYKTSLDFIDGEGVGFDEFINLNQDAIISDEHTNLILYFDISNIRHNVKDIVQLHLEYFDSNSNDNIIFYDSQIYNNTIVGNVDSLVVDIAPLIQKYLVNDINYNNFILSASSYYHNFSNIVIKKPVPDNDRYTPRLEIFYSK